MSTLNPETVRDFVIASHFNLPRVQELLAQEPTLLTAQHQWGENDFEDGLGAAAHVGNQEIARFFLAQGVASNICVVAMLGDDVEFTRLLAQDPTLANAHGAHQIPLVFHVALGGNTRIAQALADVVPVADVEFALLAATMKNRLEMVQWLLDYGVSDLNVPNYEGKTSLKIAIEQGFSAIADVLRSHGAGE
jgi:ankyrin repeat protein